MRKLVGVIDSKINKVETLKKHSLFFDGLHAFNSANYAFPGGKRSPLEPEFEYLIDRDFISVVADEYLTGIAMRKSVKSNVDFAKFVEAGSKYMKEARARKAKAADLQQAVYLQSDFFSRAVSIVLSEEKLEIDLVPVCRSAVESISPDELSQKTRVLQVAMHQFPMPGDMSAWDDIFDFKQEMHDKQWHFRRFLNALATKKQSEAEIRDDIEWTLNEYTKAMRIHNLKAGNSFVEVYVLPVIELVEDLAKFNWSKIAKGALGVKKRQVELMEAEMKAPGRECAYVFEAQKRFGQSI